MLAQLKPLLGSPVTAVLVTGYLAAVTGGLHLDGVADVCDGMGGGRGDPQRTLEVMRDPRVGAHGVVGLCLLLLGKCALLARCLDTGLDSALLLAPVCARASMVPLLTLPSARPGGLGDLVRPPHPHRATLINLLLVAFVIASNAPQLWFAPCGCLIAMAFLGRWARRELGGISGDVLGATVEWAELGFLFAAALGRASI